MKYNVFFCHTVVTSVLPFVVEDVWTRRRFRYINDMPMIYQRTIYGMLLIYPTEQAMRIHKGIVTSGDWYHGYYLQDNAP